MNMAPTLKYANLITEQWRDYLNKVLQESDTDVAADIEASLKHAVVVDDEDIMEGRVQFGSWVTVFGIEEEEEQSFRIVSREESLSAPGLLDASSPLAQALYGSIEGQVVRVLLGNGSNSDYEVTHIRTPGNRF